MEILNKAQVDALFQREAVLLSSEDAVPIFRAAVLFGEDATEYVKSLTAGQFWNCCTAGGYFLSYLTRRGFRAAASFYNVQQLREEVQA